MNKTNGGDAAISIPFDPSEFERMFLPTLLEKARNFAHMAAGYRKQFDAEEIAAAALPILFCRCKDEATMPQAAFKRLCEETVRLSALGGDIGTGTPLDADLAGRKLGYRPVLKPWNAVPYAEHYNLPPCDRASAAIKSADLAGSPLARLGLTPREWQWVAARDGGATHVEAARLCGKDGSDKSREAFSLRMAANLRRKAVAKGIAADYDDGRGRSFAKPLPTATPNDEDDWRDAVLSGKINLERGI